MRSCHSVQMKEKCNQFLSTTFQICGSISGGNAADDGRGAGAYGYRLTTNINTPLMQSFEQTLGGVQVLALIRPADGRRDSLPKRPTCFPPTLPGWG